MGRAVHERQAEMPRILSNDVELYYETHGADDGPVLILLCGLGDQLITWKPGFISRFLDANYRVICLDNRDAGLSQKMDQLPVPKLMAAVQSYLVGEETASDYNLEDMAHDVCGLLDGLEVSRAHVCGASMGGMIAQTFAGLFPSKCRSLISIMSSTGRRDLPLATPEAMQSMLNPAPTDRADYIEYSVGVRQILEGGVLPFDETRARADAAAAFDRCHYPSGYARQLSAILSSSDKRRSMLQDLKLPTLVIHGRADPLLPFACGEDTAACIPDARFLPIDGLGHDIPESVWARVTDEMIHLMDAN
jgi:pimeloyl-ACP methyl ester carboxylesterase